VQHQARHTQLLIFGNVHGLQAAEGGSDSVGDRRDIKLLTHFTNQRRDSAALSGPTRVPPYPERDNEPTACPDSVYRPHPESHFAEQWPPGKNSTGGCSPGTCTISTGPALVETMRVSAMNPVWQHPTERSVTGHRSAGMV